MRLFIGDIGARIAATPADLSDVAFEGSPDAVRVEGVGDVVKSQSETVGPDGPPSEHDEWFDLSRVSAPPACLRISWDGGCAVIDLVAYHYCTLDDVLDTGAHKASSPRDLGHGELDAFLARNWAEHVAEDLMGRTYRRVLRVQHGCDPVLGVVRTEWPVSGVVTPGWGAVGDSIVVPSGRRDGAAPSYGDIEYVCGHDDGTPPDVGRAVAALAASRLMVSKVPDRAIYESSAQGTTRWTLADAGSTGIPDIDAVLQRHARSRAAFL